MSLGAMRELVATNDAVLLSYIEALLRDANIDCIVADRNMSALEGSVGILPRRVLVPEQSWQQAAEVLSAAGLGQWVRADDDP